MRAPDAGSPDAAVARRDGGGTVAAEASGASATRAALGAGLLAILLL